MRQGLFPICIVCAVTATSSRKNFDKPSIATEKSFCNSKGVHSRSKQCLRIYKDHFCVAKCLLGNPKPLNYIRRMQAARFTKRSFSTPQECAAITGRDVHRGLGLHPNKQNTHGKFAMPCVFWPLCAQRHCLRD